MTLGQSGIALLILGFTLLSGYGDAQGFFGASRMWHGSNVAWKELARSGLGFGLGAVCYWFAVKYQRKIGIVATEPQTLFWFGATVIAVGVMSGTFLRWPTIDKLVAVGVLAGIAWLLVRVG